MGRKAKAYTIAEIAGQKSVSETTALRRMRGVDPAVMVDGYNGRRVRAYSKEQVQAAFPKAAKKGKV